MSIKRVIGSDSIYVQGVGTLRGVRLNSFLVAIAEINQQQTPQEPKIINVVIANTANTAQRFTYNAILFNRLNPTERYIIPYNVQPTIEINPTRTHKIILEYPIEKIVQNENWGLLFSGNGKVIQLPLRIPIVAKG